MSVNDRIVITGMGVISPFGVGIDLLWSNLKNERSAAAEITYFNTEKHKVKFACEIKNFDPFNYLDKKDVQNYDRSILYALVAGNLAMQDVGDIENYDKERVGVIFGSGVGGLGSLEEQFKILFNKGPRRVSPLIVPNMIANMSAGTLALKFGFKGINYSIASACATSNHSIATAYQMIKNGIADAILTGGTEAAITEIGISGFANMKALSKRNEEPEKASRPFAIGRDGFVMGEGSGAFFLETLTNAKKRGAKIYAEILGYGMTDDAFHMAAPNPEGEQTSRCMELAAKNSGINIDEIDYINAHGTSTPLGDIAEIKAVKKVFGEHAKKLKISSTKSQIGHLLGASGAVELAASLMSIKEGFIPKTINIEEQDPECDLDVLAKSSFKGKVETVLSNSFGFGGHNCSLIVRKIV